MEMAAFFPEATAFTTVPEPIVQSPPAKTPFSEVSIVFSFTRIPSFDDI
jgi:hypothetical protein